MLLLACLFVGIGLVTAQTQKVTGVVISEEDGQPVIGASVLVKGTQIGAITGVDGDFTLPNVPSSAKTLVISYIGMKTQEVVIKPSVKVVMMPDTEILDEVTVVAYGTKRKQDLVGSISSVKNEIISNSQATSVSNALEGAVAGLQVVSSSGQPGQDANIVLRGIYFSQQQCADCSRWCALQRQVVGHQPYRHCFSERVERCCIQLFVWFPRSWWCGHDYYQDRTQRQGGHQL